MQFMTREVFDAIIFIIIIVGLIAAFFRLRADLTRPFRPPQDYQPFNPDDDTKPNESH